MTPSEAAKQINVSKTAILALCEKVKAEKRKAPNSAGFYYDLTEAQVRQCRKLIKGRGRPKKLTKGE